TPSRRRCAQASYSPLMAWQMAGTVDVETAAWSPSAPARGGLHVPHRQPAHDAITSDSRALAWVRWAPHRREASAPAVPRSLGPARPTGPAVVLTVTSR